MDWSGWSNFKGFFGFKDKPDDDPLPTNTTGTDPTTGGDPSTNTGSESKVYKENCVYLYKGKDAKSGYLSTKCVDEKNRQKTVTGISNVSSLRVGNEVRVSVSSSKGNPLIVNGATVGGAVKPFNLSDKGFTEKAGWVSLAYKKYANDGTIESIGDKDDNEDCIYVYDDREGKSKIATICKSNMNGILPANDNFRRASAIRVGKNQSIVITDSDYLSKNRYAVAFGEAGVKKLIDLEPKRLNKRVQYVNIHTRK